MDIDYKKEEEIRTFLWSIIIPDYTGEDIELLRNLAKENYLRYFLLEFSNLNLRLDLSELEPFLTEKGDINNPYINSFLIFKEPRTMEEVQGLIPNSFGIGIKEKSANVENYQARNAQIIRSIIEDRKGLKGLNKFTNLYCEWIDEQVIKDVKRDSSRSLSKILSTYVSSSDFN